MNIVNATTCYALLALGCIETAKGNWVGAEKISNCTGVPLPTMKKVLHGLSRAGLIRTRRGVQGGFVLSRLASEIRLTEVIESFEGKNWRQSCLAEMPQPQPVLPRGIYQFIERKFNEIAEELDQITLADLENCDCHTDLVPCYVI